MAADGENTPLGWRREGTARSNGTPAPKPSRPGSIRLIAAMRRRRHRSNDDRDLAEMAVSPHHRQRLADLPEREGLVDRQGERAGLDRRPQVGAHPPVDVADLRGRPGAEGDAD